MRPHGGFLLLLGAVSLASLLWWARVDRDERRGPGGQALRLRPEVTAFLRGWAYPSPGDTGAGGWPLRVRRVRDDADMVLVPAGSFWMGLVPQDPSRVEDEQPRHEVRLSAYYMDVTEVTNAQFQRFAEATQHVTNPELEGRAEVFNPEDAVWRSMAGVSWRRPWPRASGSADWGTHPVVLVSWFDAIAYAAWVGASLPTEAQFERALRGGLDGRIYPWGDGLPPPPRAGNFMDETFQEGLGSARTSALLGYDDGSLRSARVAAYAQNSLGLHDLHGNVWEWCKDGFDEEYYAVAPPEDPCREPSTVTRVRRGGGWNTGQGGRLRCSWRDVADASACRDYCGFRCARSVLTPAHQQSDVPARDPR